MREILFRGKNTDNCKWKYGSLLSPNEFNEIPHIVYIDYLNEYGEIGEISAPVIPETIGQYTGLTDKNGVKIFEGDILKAFGYNYVIMWDSIRAMFYLRDPVYRVTSDFYNYCGSDLSVIGNIHDNPEILKGGEDNG